MPLQENPNLANKHKSLALPATRSGSPALKKFPSRDSLFSVMRTKSRALISVATERTSPDADFISQPTAPPKLIVENVEPSLNMPQVNGLFKESPVEKPRIPSGRVVSPSIFKSASLQLADATPAATIEPAWSSAIGHASTGKSGRVIERLQGDIDRLHREKQLLKVQYEEVEKANETLVTRNQYLQDRNNNYEHTHETTQRQLERKERQVQELREELKREKTKTARAEERAELAATNEENWRDKADQAHSLATQKETEYATVVACRQQDSNRYQTGLDKIRTNFETLLHQREQDLDKQNKLEIIAEQQRKTIEQLEELTRKLSANFKQYRTEIDAAVADLRGHAAGTNQAMDDKLEEMTKVTGLMKWVMNVEREVNHKIIPPMPEQQFVQTEPAKQQPTSPKRNEKANLDMKIKHSRKKTSKTIKP